MKKNTALISVLALILVFGGTMAAAKENNEPTDQAGQVEQTNQEEGQQINEQETERASRTIQSLGQTIKEIRDTIPEKSQIREQVRTQLKEMLDSQENLQLQAQQRLLQLKSRGKGLKFFVGPNYGAINQLEKQIEANVLRIQGLTALKEQTTSESEKAVTQQMIDALNQENTALQNVVSGQTKSFSLFGWFFRLFSK